MPRDYVLEEQVLHLVCNHSDSLRKAAGRHRLLSGASRGVHGRHHDGARVSAKTIPQYRRHHRVAVRNVRPRTTLASLLQPPQS